PSDIEQQKGAGEAIGFRQQAGRLENPAAGFHHFRFAFAAPKTSGDEKVLEDGELFERRRNLMRAADAGDAALLRAGSRDIAPVEQHAAGAWRQRARDEAEQSRFAGAIGPDNAERLAL